jgi:hypothetical protein
MTTYVKNAFAVIAVCGLLACVESGRSETPEPEAVAEEVQASSGSCTACFFEWSYCDDNCTPECAGVSDWSACFQQCQERCWNQYYNCFASCEI